MLWQVDFVRFILGGAADPGDLFHSSAEGPFPAGGWHKSPHLLLFLAEQSELLGDAAILCVVFLNSLSFLNLKTCPCVMEIIFRIQKTHARWPGL